MEILAYFGGLIYILYRILCYVLRPISEYSFSLKAARHLFIARTTYQTLFLSQDEQEKEKQRQMRHMTEAEKNELYYHREIHVSNKRRCCLYIVYMMRCFLRTCCWDCISEKYSQLLYLKQTAKKRVTEDLDIVDIIKRNREVQVILENSKIDENIRYKINHSYNNTINLDEHKE